METSKTFNVPLVAYSYLISVFRASYLRLQIDFTNKSVYNSRWPLPGDGSWIYSYPNNRDRANLSCRYICMTISKWLIKT